MSKNKIRFCFFLLLSYGWVGLNGLFLINPCVYNRCWSPSLSEYLESTRKWRRRESRANPLTIFHTHLIGNTSPFRRSEQRRSVSHSFHRLVTLLPFISSGMSFSCLLSLSFLSPFFSESETMSSSVRSSLVVTHLRTFLCLHPRQMQQTIIKTARRTTPASTETMMIHTWKLPRIQTIEMSNSLLYLR